MDLGGRKAWRLPGGGIFVAGRKRTGSKSSQGSIPSPTTMTTPALCPPQAANSEAEGHLGLRRRTTNLFRRLASDCRVAHNCSPMPWVAHTSRRFCRDVCALLNRRTPELAPNDPSAQPAKSAKIVGTNSASLLESIKPRKNELRTNSKRTPELAEICAVETRNPLNEAHSIADSPPLRILVGPKQIGEFEKDTKIVGTNSTSLLESTKAQKTNSKRTPLLA